MELLGFSSEQLLVFFVCLARISGLIGGIPIFSGIQTPLRIRAGLALTLSLIIVPGVASSITSLPHHPLLFGIIVVSEAILGYLLGFTAKLIIFAAQFGGTVVGYLMGFAAANIMDPQNQQQTPLISQFQNVIALLLFLALNIHHLFIRAIVKSFELLPVAPLDFSGDVIPYLMNMTSDMFVLGIRLCAPLLALLLLSDLVMAIMSRVFPQLNVFLLKFPVNIGLGMIVMGITLDLVVGVLGNEFQSLSERFINIFQLM